MLRRRMLRLLFCLYTLGLSTANADCGEAFQKLHQDLERKVSALKTLTEGRVTTLESAIPGLMGLCITVIESSPACAFLAGVGFGARGATKQKLAEEIELLKDSDHIYIIYESIRRGQYPSPPVEDLFTTLGVTTSQEGPAVKAVTQLVESGALCTNNQPAKTYAEFQQLIRDRMP